MEGNIDKLLSWIDDMIKKYDPNIGNTPIKLSTQKEIISQISYLIAKFENIDIFIYERLQTIKDRLFYMRDIVNNVSPLNSFPQYNYQFPYIPQTSIITVKENKIFINICMFCRLHEILLNIKNNRENDYEWVYIHPKVIAISKQKYLDGHYADSVESAFKYINTYIKNIYLQFDPSPTPPDGSSLMGNVFSNNPIKILLSDQSTETGRNIQKGYARIFEGCMLAIRNQTAHDNIKMSREMAFEKLALASLLLYRLEKAKVITPTKE